jgi:RNA polymerase sigma-70 factor (ECF subfamily)
MSTNDPENFELLSDEELGVVCARRPVVQDAFDELYRRYRAPVMRQVTAKTAALSRAQVEDLTQETFLRLFSSLPRYDPARLPLKSYVHMLADRVMIDFLRYGSLERAQTVAIEDHVRVLQIHAQADPELLIRVAEHLARQIEDTSKIPLVLDLLKGMEPKQVAALHGVKLNQAYAASARLREILEDISAQLPFPTQKIPAGASKNLHPLTNK